MKKSKLKIVILLALVIGFGAFLRFYRLSSVPVALNGDEAAFGYNAFSVLNTLKDEHGQFLPTVFKSFGDYKPPVFVYLLVPIVKIFGLTEIAVRAPIAFVSTILILLTFLISKRIFNSNGAALIASLLVTISPWAINFSRAGWEASLALFITTLALYLFVANFKNRWIVISLIVFMVGFYTYHSEKVTVPLLIISLFILFRKKINLSFKKYLSLGILLFFLAIPALIQFTNISGQSRAKGSIVTDYFFHSLKDKDYNLTQNLVRETDGFVQNPVFHSRIALSFTDISSKFYAYLSPANLLVYGDEVGRHGVQDFGVLYTFDFILIIIAAYFFIKKTKNDFDIFLIVWLFIGLFPAMITMDKLHSIRPLLAMPALYIFEGWGFVQLLQKMSEKRKVLAGITIVILIAVLTINFLRFSESYFIYTPIERADWWQYGYKQVVQTIQAEQNRFDKVIVDVPPLYGNPYIFFLFYQQYDPNIYNQTVKREDDPVHKVTAVYGFGKYQFRQIYWPKDNALPKTLFVGTDESLPKKDVSDPKKFKLIKEINMPNGATVFRIVETL